MVKAPILNVAELPALSDLALCMTIFTFAAIYRTKEERQIFIDTWIERARLQNLKEDSINKVVKYFNDTMDAMEYDG